MSNSGIIKTAFSAERAAKYDKKAAGHRWIGPEVIFGMAFGFVKSHETVLDIGIGTGLSSTLFHKAGLSVKGMDFSPEMLEVCRQKEITVDLKEHNILSPPYPYDSDSVDHAVCAGVMHLVDDLAPIFNEVARIIKDGGTFTFALSCRSENEDKAITYESKEIRAKSLVLYKYSDADVRQQLERFGLKELSSVEFNSTPIAEELSRFKAYVVKKGRE